MYPGNVSREFWKLCAGSLGVLRGRWDYLGGSWRDLGSVPSGPWSALVGSPGGLRGLEGSLELWEAFWEIIGGVLERPFSFCSRRLICCLYTLILMFSILGGF